MLYQYVVYILLALIKTTDSNILDLSEEWASFAGFILVKLTTEKHQDLENPLNAQIKSQNCT